MVKNKTGGYWDKSLEMGRMSPHSHSDMTDIPAVVGQGTHIGKSESHQPRTNNANNLVDLTRYLSSSPVIPETIHVQTVEHSDPVGKLSQQKFVEEDLVPSEMRVPRITNATWRTENKPRPILRNGLRIQSISTLLFHQPSARIPYGMISPSRARASPSQETGESEGRHHQTRSCDQCRTLKRKCSPVPGLRINNGLASIPCKVGPVMERVGANDRDVRNVG